MYRDLHVGPAELLRAARLCRQCHYQLCVWQTTAMA